MSISDAIDLTVWNSLEVVKLIISIMTPLAVFFLSWLVNERLRTRENVEQERGRIAQEQIRYLQEQQLRLANRNEFQRLTLEINRELIRDPSLDAFDHPDPNGTREPAQVRLEALAYIYMNMFELIYQYYHPSDNAGTLTQREEEEWRVWDETIKSTLDNSLILRAVVEKEESPRIYYAGFVDYIKTVLRQVQDDSPNSAS